MKMLNKFFNPQSIAVIGASKDENKLGTIILSNFVNNQFKNLYPINPNADFILGKKAYKSVLEVKNKIDLAIIVVPAKIVPQVLLDCVKKRIEAVIIISSGFSEIGSDGKKLEEECENIIKNTKIRVIGPNCVGVYDPYSQVDTLFLSRERCGRPKKGYISFISQSGAVGSTILDLLSEENIGISKFISYGNGMDINETDLIEFLEYDNKTKVIMVYLEGIKERGDKFIKIVKKVTKKKPIIVLKAGKSEKGAEVVSSHTGSLAGSGRVYSSIMRQVGIIEAKDWESLTDYSIALSTQPLPRGNKIVIITDGGGFGVLATDEAEKQGLILPEPSEKLKQKMKKSMPDYVSLHNPIDLTGDANVNRYKIAIEECMKSNEYDGIILITLFQVPTLGEEIVDYLIYTKNKIKKPLLICSTGGKFSKRLNEKMVANNIPVYPSPERAIKAMNALIRYSKVKGFIKNKN